MSRTVCAKAYIVVRVQERAEVEDDDHGGATPTLSDLSRKDLDVSRRLDTPNATRTSANVPPTYPRTTGACQSATSAQPVGISETTTIGPGVTERAQTALLALDELTRRLRRECPWDREQDERSIVPHTVEEAYELADAAHSGDDAKLLDELGDVLFQVHFLGLLLEERGAGSLAAVAEHCTEKLIRRHPHIFGDTTVADCRRGPAQLGRDQAHAGGPRHAVRRPAREPAGAVAGAQGPAPGRSSGFDFPDVDVACEAVRDELAELEQAADRAGRFHEVGDVLFAAVNLARKLGVDPELALRAATDRFCGRVGGAEAEAASAGEVWSELPRERQLEHYARARLRESPKGAQ